MAFKDASLKLIQEERQLLGPAQRHSTGMRCWRTIANYLTGNSILQTQTHRSAWDEGREDPIKHPLGTYGLK